MLAFVVASTTAGEVLSAVAGLPVDAFTLAVLSFPVVGALVASRHPGNNFGWLLLGLGVVLGLTDILDAYAIYALELRPGSLPRPEIFLALTAPTWVPVIGLPGTFFILLFPDGRLPSPRWKAWAWFCAMAMIVSYAAILLQPYSFDEVGHPDLENPFGIEALRPVKDQLLAVLLTIPLAIAGCAVALVGRYRRSRGRLRLQLKWLAAAGAIIAVVYGLMMLLSIPFMVVGDDPPAWLEALSTLAVLPFFLLPVAMGAAILRHRLYDIDVIINRALVYGGLTIALALVYALSAVATGSFVRTMTGHEGNDFAVAASTLAVTALFGPLRRRLQSLIDRRFYRQKYSAEQTLGRFAARLRDEIDLDALHAEVVSVVATTMQPRHVSLWLRGAR